MNPTTLRYIYGWEAATNEKVVLLADAEALRSERDQLQTQLEAWHKTFETTQLSHALARLEKAEGDLQRLKGEKLPKRQDALLDQLRDLVLMGVQAGCYDAVDYLLRQTASELKRVVQP